MKNLFLFLVVIFTFASRIEARFADRKIFVSKFTGTKKTIAELETIRNKVRANALSSLAVLPKEVKTELLEHAESVFHKTHYPVKTATDFMEYFRNGNRAHYERKLGDHWTRISALLVGHLLDGQVNASSTKYLDEIVNGVWATLEESTWALPAHLYLQKTADKSLPTPGGRPAIDLEHGTVAKNLGWVKLMVGPAFDKFVSPVVNKRIDFELRRRIFEPFLEIDDYFWEGFTGGHVTNNWNIWVNGNILKSAVFTLGWNTKTSSENELLFNKVLNKTLYSADYFLDGYGEDGGCDEGPAYWRQAGGRLIEYLESLDQLFPGGASGYFSKMPLLKRIGEYAYKMRIDANWYVNFADAIPVLSYPPSLLYQYGLLFDDENMKQFSSYVNNLKNPSGLSKNHTALIHDLSDLNEFFSFITYHSAIEKEPPVAPHLTSVWLPDIEVVTGRAVPSTSGSHDNVLRKAFFMAAKAGTNYESHNHNDVGSFVLFAGPNPILIDVGVGTYTAATFGSHRYDLWYITSAYHNVPTINGVLQHQGTSYSAHNTTFKNDESLMVFSSDIAGAYLANASVKSWVRTFNFSKNINQLIVEDSYQLNSFLTPQKLHFMTLEGIKIEKTPTGLLLVSEGKEAPLKDSFKVSMDFDTSVLEFSEEVKSLDGDHHLTQVWGENVKRITLTTVTSYKKTEGTFRVTFKEV